MRFIGTFIIVSIICVLADLLAAWYLMLALGNLGLNMSYSNSVWTSIALGGFLSVIISANLATDRVS